MCGDIELRNLLNVGRKDVPSPPFLGPESEPPTEFSFNQNLISRFELANDPPSVARR